MLSLVGFKKKRFLWRKQTRGYVECREQEHFLRSCQILEIKDDRIIHFTIYQDTAQMTSIHNGPPLREGSDDEIDPQSSGRSVRICQLSVLVDNNNIIRSVNFDQDTLGTKVFHFSMCAQVLETE